jgi:uncharacterized protein (TIGR00288 family)
MADAVSTRGVRSDRREGGVSEPSIAVFIDFENLVLGARSVEGARTFRIELVLKRLLEKGRVVYKRAYCDWSNYRTEVREFHSQGIELVDIPQSKMSGKNSADIRMVVDAIDLCHTKQNIDVFALVSGDSDFSPLVSKLKENDKRVIGCGIRSSTSNLLVANCDEFIYYDDLVKAFATKPPAPRKKEPGTKKTEKPAPSAPRAAAEKPELGERAEAIDQVMEIVRSLQADYDPLWGSLVKQTVRRVHPSFQEGHYGYRTFSELLEELEDLGYVDLDYDERRGNYKVSLVGE